MKYDKKKIQKKQVLYSIMFLLISFILVSCANKGTNVESDNISDNDTKVEKEADWDALNEVLVSVQNAVPGTAGCSLKAVIAAGSVIDWCEDNITLTDQDNIWEQIMIFLNDKDQCMLTKEEVEDTWTAVAANAMDLINEQEDIQPYLEDSGYTLKHDAYTEEYFQTFSDAFMQAAESMDDE